MLEARELTQPSGSYPGPGCALFGSWIRLEELVGCFSSIVLWSRHAGFEHLNYEAADGRVGV
jgi:hypothetical protein